MSRISIKLLLGIVLCPFLLWTPLQAQFLFSSGEGFQQGGNQFDKYSLITTNGASVYGAIMDSLSVISALILILMFSSQSGPNLCT